MMAHMKSSECDRVMTAAAVAAGGASWRRIARMLEEAIAEGRFATGARLPSEAALAASFGVNRHTLRRALASLAERGLVRTERGRGSFVADIALDYPIRERTRFSATLIEQGRLPRHELIAVLEVPAEAAIAAALELAPGSALARLDSLGLADDRPLSLASSWLPLGRFPDLLERARALRSITRLLEAYGIDHYRRASTRIHARPAEAEEVLRLKQSPRQPVLVTEAVDVDEAGRPVRFGRTAFAAGRVQLTVEPPA